MRRKRPVSEEERAEFKAAFVETAPLQTIAKPPKPIVLPQPKPPRRDTGGLDGNTASRLRKGTLDPDARIDLHGMTEDAAHRSLLVFLRQAQRGGARLVLVITGKGGAETSPFEPYDMERERRARGILKTMVPRWLKQPAFAGLIADTRAAHRRHGGAGAMYVYLRKMRD